LSLNLLQEAARNETRNAELQFDFAQAAYAMGQVPDAEAAARAALQTAPAFSGAEEARRFLSMTALAANSSPAGAQAQEILKSNPDYVPALMVMAVMDEQKNDVGSAAQIYKKVLGLYPYFAPAQRRLAILFAKNMIKDPQGYEFATKARVAFPDDPEVAKALGIILFLQGDYTRAERLLNETAAAGNADPEMLYYLGMAQYNLKKSAECKKNLQKALSLNLSTKFNQEAKRVLAELK
jgi:tetratricopeptide (TPR) repeat protein